MRKIIRWNYQCIYILLFNTLACFRRRFFFQVGKLQKFSTLEMIYYISLLIVNLINSVSVNNALKNSLELSQHFIHFEKRPYRIKAHILSDVKEKELTKNYSRQNLGHYLLFNVLRNKAWI